MVDSLSVGILSLSVLLQVTAAYFAFQLVKVTKSRGWLFLGIAFLFMGLSGLVSLFAIYYGAGKIFTGLLPELVALLISVLMIAGVLYISDYFRSKAEAERAIAESEERYRTLVETMNESVVTIDSEGRITYANSKAAELFGPSVDDLIGTPITNYCGEECSWQFMQGFHQPQEVPITLETRISDVNRNIKEVLVNISPIFDDKGEITGTIATFSDITQLKETDEKLRNYAKKLKQNSELKDLFIDILHHDLLNYTSIIKGYAELAQSDGLDSETITVINRNAERIIEVIENATKFSKLASIDKIRKVELNVAEIINEVLEEFKSMLSEADMTVENRISTRLSVKANPIVKEIFWNFLSNAIKYAEEGKNVVIYAEDAGDCWNICFADFGPGVRDEQKETIFDRFSRGGKGGVKGSGLGLAIAKRVAELHGGEVGVADNKPKGSIFWVKLPKGE
jgi:two-component system phosphate regulon sensor histidine kinase PhoR